MLYFLLAAIGVVLLLPTGTKKTSEETEQPQETAARPAGDAGLSVQEEMEQRLCDALSQMDGVGAVHVVVTLESTGKKIVEKDVPIPTFISEYGGIKWDEEGVEKDGWGYGAGPATKEEFLNRYKGLTDALLDNPHMFAFCYTQLYDVEQELNGLYTYERKPKFDMDVIKAINARKAAIED